MANTTVRFKKYDAKALVQQISGREPRYPVYYFGKTVKTEQPERPGQQYRWVTS